MPSMPDIVTHQHLLRAMDALMDNADVVEEALARQFRPLVDQVPSIVFYDLTTVRIHGEGKVEADIRAYGTNKEMARKLATLPGSSCQVWFKELRACR